MYNFEAENLNVASEILRNVRNTKNAIGRSWALSKNMEGKQAV